MNPKSIANLESFAGFSVKTQGYWNEVGTRYPASVGILGHLGLLGLHKLHSQRVSKSHHSRGRAACWLLHTLPLFLARASGSSCQGVSILPYRRRTDNPMRGRVRLAMLQRVAVGLLLV